MRENDTYDRRKREVMTNSVLTIHVTISILILLAGAASSAIFSTDPVCPSGTTPCNGSCINETISCNRTCSDGTILCNGTCVATSTDAQNCGACGNVCSLGTFCIKGNCSCMAGLALCNKTCTDTSIDPRNCGECGNVCPGFAICNQGTCSNASPQICIDGDCSNPIIVQHRRL